jgi:hypothetical protein
MAEDIGFGLQLLEVGLRCNEFCVPVRNLAGCICTRLRSIPCVLATTLPFAAFNRLIAAVCSATCRLKSLIALSSTASFVRNCDLS